MAKNRVEDLRDHCFEAMERLRDAKGDALKQEIERSKTVADVAQVIVDSAKVEVSFINATGAKSGCGFLPDDSRRPPLPSKGKVNE